MTTGTTTLDSRAASSDRPRSGGDAWRAEGLDLVRAASGGLLFGVPLLFTMEVWWIGSHTEPWQMAVALGGLFVPIFALNRTGGFRQHRDRSAVEAAGDTVEAVAVGLVVTTAVLILIREVDPGNVTADIGKIIYESIPFCLGVGVARYFLQPRGGRMADGEGDAGEGALHGTVRDLAAAMIGAMFVALSIAPTDEIPLIASTMNPEWLLVVLGASLLATYAIVFVAGFARQDERHAHEGLFQRPFTETVAAYLVALLVSVLLLWVFQRGTSPWTDLLDRALVLGFPAAIGGAAGRLAV
jgi:putative integral membrane protein (TIGR02587 family)